MAHRATALTLLGLVLTLPACVPPPAYTWQRTPYAPYPMSPYARPPSRYGFYPDPNPAADPPASAEPPRRAAATPARSRPAAPPRATADAPAPPATPTPVWTPTPTPTTTPAAPPAAASPECRTVTQLGYVDGKEVQRQQQLCRAAPGREWFRS